MNADEINSMDGHSEENSLPLSMKLSLEDHITVMTEPNVAYKTNVPQQHCESEYEEILERNTVEQISHYENCHMYENHDDGYEIRGNTTKCTASIKKKTLHRRLDAPARQSATEVAYDNIDDVKIVLKQV